MEFQEGESIRSLVNDLQEELSRIPQNDSNYDEIFELTLKISSLEDTIRRTDDERFEEVLRISEKEEKFRQQQIDAEIKENFRQQQIDAEIKENLRRKEIVEKEEKFQRKREEYKQIKEDRKKYKDELLANVEQLKLYYQQEQEELEKLKKLKLENQKLQKENELKRKEIRCTPNYSTNTTYNDSEKIDFLISSFFEKNENFLPDPVVIIPRKISSLVIENICNETGTTISYYDNEKDQDPIGVIEGSPSAVLHAKQLLKAIIESTKIPKRGKKKPQTVFPPSYSGNIVRNPVEGQIYVFVDNSNISIGAKYKNGIQDPRIRINIPNLVEVVERGRKCASRSIVGSIPGNNEEWKTWRKYHYKVKLGVRVISEGNKKRKELFADEALHSMMVRQFLVANYNHKKTAVILTGDGNDHEEGTATFPMLVVMFVRANWFVEVWSWRNSLNKQYLQLKKDFPGRVNVFYLDVYRDDITYIKNWSVE